MADVENYPHVLPKNVLSVKKLEETNSSLVYEMTVQEKGFETTLLVRHDLFPYDEQILTVIDGDAENTVIHQKFQKQDNSTKLITDIEINLSGILSPFQYIPRTNFNHAMGTVLVSFAEYATEKTKNERIVDDLYREILKRPVDQEGLDYFTALLEKNEITPELIKLALYASEEYLFSLPIELKDVDELTDETKNTINELYEIILRRGADTEGMQHFGSLLEGDRGVTELYIITELLKSDEFGGLPVPETRVDEFVGYDKISKENIEIIKTVYFETTGKDVDKIIEAINVILEKRLLLYNHLQAAFIEYAETCGTECITEEQYTVLEAHTMLWNNDDKLIYALATFLEYEKMTIDEISEFLVNLPETWTFDFPEIIQYATKCYGTTCITEEQYTELKSKGLLLWMYDDKLIYALATFLESEKMTIDEISEFLLNNPETWKPIEQRLWNVWT
jgi:ribosome-associated toxin RatA of RatAB toxin-antitoxin module